MRYVVAVAALLLAATGCSDPDEPDRARDPGGGTRTPAPAEIPNPVTVMDVGRPELCTGPIAESYPPQCGGPAIRDWRWSEFDETDYQQVGQVRWGEFVVDGHLEGDEFVVTSAEPVEHSYS